MRCHVCALPLDERVGYRAAVQFGRPMEDAAHARIEASLLQPDRLETDEGIRCPDG